MSILGTFIKQPADVLDYDIDYRDWLADRSDTLQSATVTAETGLTVSSFVIVQGVVKVFLSGGTDGGSYKVTCTATTAGGRVKQAEIRINVKDF